MSRHGVTKRVARVPDIGRCVGAAVSKADLLEALWYLASLQNEDSYDDRLQTITNLIRALDPEAQIKALKALRKSTFASAAVARVTEQAQGA
jgi:ribosomal 50S subunit-associated protein YjgA (DUF615 family)